MLLVGTIGGALPANADDGPKPLAPRRLFDQSRPGVELITAKFTGELAVPQPQLSAASRRALQARVLERIQRGEVPANEAAARNAVIAEIVRDPLRWFTAGERIDRMDLKVSAMGSGFSIGADGYIVTNAHVVAPQSETLKATFLREGFGDEFQDSLQHLVEGGVPQSLATKLLEAGLRWATRRSKLSHFKRRLEAVTSSGTGGTGGTGGTVNSGKGRPAELITAGREIPGKDVAVIKVAASNMATVQLGDDTALSTGDRLFVLGFPGPATFSPVLSKESQKEPTLTQGVLSAKKTASEGFTVLQTDAAMTHGNSGGPVFDEQGRVVGVATFGSVDPSTGREISGLNFAVPASIVNELLHHASVTAAEGPAGSAYRQALDAIDKQWYKRSLPLLERVRALDPGHPLASKLIKDAQTAIRQGRDRTPREILGLPVLVVAGLAGVVVVVLVGVGALVLVSRRQRRRRRGGGPSPGPAGPGAGWGAQPGGWGAQPMDAWGAQPEPASATAPGPAPPASADPPWVMPPASANPAETQPPDPGTPESAERNRDWQQSRWIADESQTVEVPATGNAEPAPVPRAETDQAPPTQPQWQPDWDQAAPQVEREWSQP